MKNFTNSLFNSHSINSNIEFKHDLSDILGKSMSRDEVLDLIENDANTRQTFYSIREAERENIISFIQGQQGIKVSYDVFFQKIFSYDEHKERLESLLSALLDKDISIKSILPREGIRISEEGSFTIMDIVAELSDKSIINVEMQNRGYYFPGERSCCYEADMIMRQYNRMKHELKQRFTYKSMPPVYLIILMEQSSKEFKEVSPTYVHNKIQSFDS